MASLSFILGIIGNVISILMFLSPLKTFKRIIRKKSTEDFKGLPYITTLLSTSLWSLYGLLKPGGLLVVTVNGTGAILHIIYVILFLVYAPKDTKIKSLKLVAIIDVGFYGVVVIVTLLALHGSMRLTLVGLLCAALTIGMYASPLVVMRTVIKMKSVEYMPFFLSFFQFLNGGIWAAYALLVKDIYMGVPNGIGFILGSCQILLYVVYKKKFPKSTSMEAMEEEEEGSAHLIKRKIQMQDFDDDKEINNRNLSKVASLPNPKSTIERQYSPKIVKTISLSPDAFFNIDAKDLELGHFKENY